MRQEVHKLRKQVDDILVEMGGMFLFEDIVAAVRNGYMQSFGNDDAWVVTQIANYPQKRVLDIVFACGDLEVLEVLYSDVMGYAREQGIDTVMAPFARLGWESRAKQHGWRRVASWYLKDLSDGS